MGSVTGQAGGRPGGGRYEIRVGGSLDARWSGGFSGLTVTNPSARESLLTGPVADQSALHGVLARIRDLGLPLLLVRRLGPDDHPDRKETS